MIAPNPLVGQIHALLALASGLDQSAIGFQDGLLEEGSRLLLPDSQANVVDDVQQGVDVNLLEAPEEVASRGRIGDSLGAQGVEVNLVVAQQFEILQDATTHQEVIGDVEDVIGLEVRD